MLRKCIDIHTHVYLPRYINMLKSRSQVPRIFSSNGTDRLVILPGEDLDPSTAIGRPIGPDYFNVDAKIGFMDLHGISHSVISLANPWLDFLPASEAQSMATLLNNDLQELCKHPRLNAFGVLPTLSAHGSILELERISKLDQLVGVIMGTHGLGKGLDDPELEPVFAKASELGLVVFLHPHYSVPASLFGPIENGHVLPLALGFPFETTIVFSC